jgi:hypothetical protein
MIRRFLLWLTARLPVKVIGRPGSPYVEWYHVATLPGLFRVQLHRFLRSDPDGLHDHPWGWACSIILAGWYFEERRDRVRVRSRGYAMNGDTFHRVVLPHACDVWTLFIHGPYVKHWGFITPLQGSPSWYRRAGGLWRYQARTRDAEGFSTWPWDKDTPRGRDIREELAA